MANVCVSCPAPRRRRRATYRRAPVRRRRAPARRRYNTSVFRSQRRRTNRKIGNLSMGGHKRGFTKFELAQVNPFDRLVDGAKIPDSNTQPSDTIKSEDRITVTGAATNLAKAIALFPTLVNNSIVSTDSTATVWSWSALYGGGTNSDQVTAITGAYSHVRVVGHGARLSCSLSPTAATGFVHIAAIPLSDFGRTTWALPTTIGQMAQLPWYKRITLAALTQQQYTVPNKFIDCTATRYFDPSSDCVANSTDTNFQSGVGWCAIVIALENTPVLTGNLTVENLVHYEGIPLFSAQQNATPAADYDPTQLATTSRISSKQDTGFLDGDVASAYQAALRHAQAGAMAAGSSIYNNVILPAAYAAGSSAVYGAYNAAFGPGLPGQTDPGRLFESGRLG